jgi:hypothetical protein
MAVELAAHKKSLRKASLGGTALASLESPRALVDQILASIAPTIQEIAKRSLAPGELVIKRLVGDSRREEVFVSKKELRQKVEPLPPELRAAFDPLELWDAAPKVIVEPDPSPRVGPPPPPSPPPLPPKKALGGWPIQMISSPPPPPGPEQPPEGELHGSDSDAPPPPPRG